MKYNYVPRFDQVFNNMRSYVMDKESGLIMASWPKGRLKVPFPYFAESMSGFEYTAAVGMLYEGQTNAGLQCIRSIRDRFDGAKRNPFDEPECGHHYARAMASWAATLALTGFHYSAVEHSMRFAAGKGTYFWSNGSAWGTVQIHPSPTGAQVDLQVLYGTLILKNFTLAGFKTHQFNTSEPLIAGEHAILQLARL